MVYRHPFPGPGLGVRILGAIKREYADLLREADAIFIEELRNAGWYDKVSQAFVVFLPVKSVGVMGDGRTYDWVVSLRAVQTSDFMTAKWAICRTISLARFPIASSTRLRALIASFMMYQGNPLPRLSGSDQVAFNSLIKASGCLEGALFCTNFQ